MSAAFDCKCAERKKPIAERDWAVIQYRCNHSAFNGYHYTPSDYSTVVCNKCRACGRTKAAYVASLKRVGLPPEQRPTQAKPTNGEGA